MKLLGISHACVTPVNQALFAEVERQTGWDLTIVAPAAWKSEYGRRQQLERWPAFQGELVPVPVWMSGNVPLHVYRTFFASLLRRVDPDVIYVHHEPYAAATAQVYLANRLTINRPIGFFTWQNIRKRYPIPFRQLEQMVFRQSRYAVSGSESARAVLRAKNYRGPIDIIPAGIDPDLYAVSSGNGEVKDELRSAPDEVLIGFVGRVAEEKGLRTLLQALKRMRDLSWRLIVIGAGPFEQAFDEQANALGLAGRVERLGYVPHTETPRYLAAFDLLVLPSETQDNWKEQFGRVIIEAMACGTPVIGSDSGEIPHLLAATGGGDAFPEGRSGPLAACLTRLVKNPEQRHALARTGRQAVLQHYTHSALARRFAGIIEQAAGDAHG